MRCPTCLEWPSGCVCGEAKASAGERDTEDRALEAFCDSQWCHEAAIDECPACRLRACKRCRDTEGVLDDCCEAAFAHPDFERTRTAEDER